MKRTRIRFTLDFGREYGVLLVFRVERGDKNNEPNEEIEKSNKDIPAK